VGLTKTENKITKNKIYENQIQVQIKTKKGDSGGIIINKDGKLIGIHSNSNQIVAGETKLFSGLDLIQKYINRLEKQTKLNLLSDKAIKLKRDLVQFIFT